MQRPQLFSGALILALAATAACSREETREQAREAAIEARAAAERAGEQLADSWLTTKIQAQYFADEDIKARYINVSTRGGVVALTGRVADERAREQAVQIARNTDGVRQVEDRLVIGPDAGAFDGQSADARAQDTEEEDAADAPATSVDPGATTGAVPTTGTALPPNVPPVVPMDDASVASRIQAKYFLDDAVKARRIDVTAAGGVVTLRGEVASEDERARALLLARTTDGVQRVEDSLTVNASLLSGVTPSAGTTATPVPAAPVQEQHDAPPEP